MTSNKVLASALAITAGLATAFATTDAHAAACAPVAISLDATTFAVSCSGTWHYSSSAVSYETIKAWVAMSQAALLAGKTLQLAENSGIVWMEIDR